MTTLSLRSSILAPLHSVVAAIAGYFEAYAEAASRADEFERLNALTDEELAARGLTRADIGRYVFRDLMAI